MFGETIDYWLLKPLTHTRNRATEVELDRRALTTNFNIPEGQAYLERIQTLFEGRLPIKPDLSYLDIGCGMGRMSLGLAAAGAMDVTGIDILPRYIAEAKTISQRASIPRPPSFLVADIHTWHAQRTYDVILGLGSMEHILQPGAFLKRVAALLRPQGRAYLSHAPFQSPLGDHLQDFFRVVIPYRGVLFSERALLRLRSECYRPTDAARRFQDVAGGLNKLSFTDYLKKIEDAGLQIEFQAYNPQFRLHPRFLALRPPFAVLSKIPRVRDYFIVTHFAILKRSP